MLYAKLDLINKFIKIFSLLIVISCIPFQLNVFADSDPKKAIAEGYRVKGFEEQKRGNFDSALTFYRKAVELGLENAVVYNDLGVLYEQLNIRSKAEEFYLKAIELDPHYLPAYTNLGYLYKAQKNTKLAEKYFIKRYELSEVGDVWADKIKTELVQINPSYKEWITSREAEKMTSDLEEQAKQEFYEKVSRSSGYFKNGEKLYKEQYYKESIEEFDRALELMPNSPKILAARDKARIDLVKQEIEMQTDQAIKLINQGDYDSASSELKSILAAIENKPMLRSK